jgi:hypothetical protein
MLTHLFRSLRWGSSRKSRTLVRRDRPRSFVPCLEVLEGRAVPSTLTVTNLSDTGVAGDGSLRGEIAAAAPGDTIVFASGLQGTIALNSTLALSKNVTIQGTTDSSGHSLITLSGQSQVRDLLVNSGVTASLSGLTLANGYLYTPSAIGGAGIENLGSLTLTSVAVSNNYAQAQGSDITEGGGIYNAGSLTVQNSTISGNSVGYTSPYASGQGGFVTGIGGGIYNSGTLNVQTSSFTGNVAGGFGEGGAVANFKTATITGCTASGNSAMYGGAFYNRASRTGASMVLSSTTVSGNTATQTGGGVYNTGTGAKLSITNYSVIAGNTGGVDLWSGLGATWSIDATSKVGTHN